MTCSYSFEKSLQSFIVKYDASCWFFRCAVDMIFFLKIFYRIYPMKSFGVGVFSGGIFSTRNLIFGRLCLLRNFYVHLLFSDFFWNKFFVIFSYYLIKISVRFAMFFSLTVYIGSLYFYSFFKKCFLNCLSSFFILSAWLEVFHLS